MKFNIEITVTGSQGTFRSNMTLEGENIDQIIEEIKNLKLFNARLKHQDLQFVANLIKEKPAIIPEIKKLIVDLEGKNMAQMLAGSAGYVKRLFNILK